VLLIDLDGEKFHGGCPIVNVQVSATHTQEQPAAVTHRMSAANVSS